VLEGMLESDNEAIKVLDLSWNSLGDHKEYKYTSTICQLLEKNKGIIHLDLSNNNFNLEESILIS